MFLIQLSVIHIRWFCLKETKRQNVLLGNTYFLLLSSIFCQLWIHIGLELLNLCTGSTLPPTKALLMDQWTDIWRDNPKNVHPIKLRQVQGLSRLPFLFLLAKDEVTDRLTDRRMDGPTDGNTLYRVVAHN